MTFGTGRGLGREITPLSRPMPGPRRGSRRGEHGGGFRIWGTPGGQNVGRAWGENSTDAGPERGQPHRKLGFRRQEPHGKPSSWAVAYRLWSDKEERTNGLTLLWCEDLDEWTPPRRRDPPPRRKGGRGPCLCTRNFWGQFWGHLDYG